MTGCAALIVSAGRGHRFGGELPKQYTLLAGEPLLRHTLRVFLDHPGVDTIRVIIHPDDKALYEAAADGMNLAAPVLGGAERQDSVRNGLESLESMAPDTVLIHDAARPFVSHDIISRVLNALKTSSGAIPAVAVGDTLKRGGENGLITETVDRAGLYRAQTPQGFRFSEILAAHRSFKNETLTDDAAVGEKAGLAIALIEGSEANFKLTSREDLLRAERRLASAETRTGMGFDVHRFVPGDHVTLGGVKIPHDRSLEGHSDADVGLHALTDALMGAIGAGDIGAHFPPGNAEWKDAPSDIFLKKAGELVTCAGGRIHNLDLTLICETPKIGPHREAMIRRISEFLNLAPGRVSVKATTTEKLGFTGRGEGIAAQAVATVGIYNKY